MGALFHAHLVKLSQSTDKKYKYKITIVNMHTNQKRIVRFGAQGYSDFPHHKDEHRKRLYIQRHKRHENWNDIFTAGFWSRWLLWNKDTIEASKRDIQRRFRVVFI
jgi:hypothetical protein